jgi:hypothetical protein
MNVDRFIYLFDAFCTFTFSMQQCIVYMTNNIKIILINFRFQIGNDRQSKRLLANLERILTTNFNLTTKITLTIKNSSLGVLDTTLCDKVCQWFATGQWFSPSAPVSFTNKTDNHDITEMLLNVTLNTLTLSPHLHPQTHIKVKKKRC